MVAVPSFDLPALDPKQAFLAREVAKLTDTERAQYDGDSSFRRIVLGALEWEWQNPGPTPTEQEAAEKYDGDTVRGFVEQFVAHVLEVHPAEQATRLAALRAQRYGSDFARELAEIQSGTHPAQQL